MSGFEVSTNTRAGKLLKNVAVAQTAWQLGKAARNFVLDKIDFTVSVDSQDAIYVPLVVWIIQQIDPAKARQIAAFTRKTGVYVEDETEDTGLRIRAAIGQTYSFRLDGQKVTARIERERADNIDSDKWLSESLVLSTHTKRGQEALIALLNKLSMKEARKASVYVASQWGDWRRKGAMRTRNLDTVYLPGDQKERLVADLGLFLEAEEMYDKLGIPWHRGYLLYGPPGTGKTSIGRALASHFNLDVYSLSLSDINSDARLGQMLGQVNERSVLLLEDIDVVHAAKERDDEDEEAITASGLLNALDGLQTPHGLITIMTTNDISVLDEALLRSGRSDVREEIGYLTQDQLEKMMLGIFGRECDFKLQVCNVTPSDVIGVIKASIHDLDAAWEDVREFVA